MNTQTDPDFSESLKELSEERKLLPDNANSQQLRAYLSQLLFQDCRAAFRDVTDWQIRRTVRNVIRRANHKLPDFDGALVSMAALAAYASSMRFVYPLEFFELNSTASALQLHNYVKAEVIRLYDAATKQFEPDPDALAVEEPESEATTAAFPVVLFRNLVLNPTTEQWVN